MRKSVASYMVFCILLGMGSLVFLTVRDFQSLKSMFVEVLFFSLLGVIAESQSLAIDENKAISISFAIGVIALLLFGLVGAAWVAFSMAFFSVMDYDRGYKEHLFNTPLHKSLMNASNYILSILACGLVYQALGGRYFKILAPKGLEETFLLIVQILPAILAALVVYVLVNTLFIMVYFFLSSPANRTVFQEWLQIFRWSLLSMIPIGALGIILSGVYQALGFVALLLFFTPFMLFRYAYVGMMSVQKSYIDTIKAFSAALEAKDTYTIGHARRVEKYCELIAKEMHLPANRTKVLKYASLLHDIGKIGIPETILNKQDRLTDEEFKEIERHPVIGAQMLSGIQFLRKEVEIIRAHHIHYDGSGYPADAAKESKQLEAQILQVADSFDAMTSDRAYRAAMSYEEAIDELERYSGTQFAPDVVRALIRGMERLRSQGELEVFLE